MSIAKGEKEVQLKKDPLDDTTRMIVCQAEGLICHNIGTIWIGMSKPHALLKKRMKIAQLELNITHFI